jgi:OpgC protein
MLGQSSLPVFCVHLLCVFFALTIMGNDPILREWTGIVVIVTSLSALLLTAKIATNRRANTARNRALVQERPARRPSGYEPGSQRIRWFERLLKI